MTTKHLESFGVPFGRQAEQGFLKRSGQMPRGPIVRVFRLSTIPLTLSLSEGRQFKVGHSQQERTGKIVLVCHGKSKDPWKTPLRRCL